MKSFNIIQRNLPLCLLLVMLAGCSKNWLDLKPEKSQAIPGKLSDYQALLNNTAQVNANLLAIGELASDGHYVTDAVFAATTNAPALNAYTWSQQTVLQTMQSYNEIYTRIFFINVVLDGLGKLNVATEPERKELAALTARAQFAKAYSYYWLSQHYAQPYRAATAATDQGILVQDNIDFKENVRRLTVEQTYTSIIDMVKEALPHLPVTPLHVTQPSQPAAHALLARVYLIMQRYEDALASANSALTLQSTLLDFSKLPTNMFFVGAFNAEVLYHDEMSSSEMNNLHGSNSLVEPALYNSFDADDLRKTIFFNQSSTTGNISFKGNYNNSNWQLFGGIANDEVYLIRAEAYARTGDATNAMKDLNDLLRTRWKKDDNGNTFFTDLTAADAGEALLLVLAERKKELLYRGLRWADLRRLNQDPAFQVTLTRTVGGNTYTLEPNNYRYTFPLPTNVLELGGQKQTTGW
jgi:hypothetical protein